MKKHKIEFSKTGKTVSIPLSVYRCGAQDTTKNLTISYSGKTKLKTTLTDKGLKKFREFVIRCYNTK